MTIGCQYWTARGKDGGTCSIKLYGGFPSLGCCQKCLKAGQNNPEYAEKFLADYSRTHPVKHRGSGEGCCGSALNY